MGQGNDEEGALRFRCIRIRNRLLLQAADRAEALCLADCHPVSDAPACQPTDDTADDGGSGVVPELPPIPTARAPPCGNGADDPRLHALTLRRAAAPAGAAPTRAFIPPA